MKQHHMITMDHAMRIASLHHISITALKQELERYHHDVFDGQRWQEVISERRFRQWLKQHERHLNS